MNLNNKWLGRERSMDLKGFGRKKAQRAQKLRVFCAPATPFLFN